MAANAFGYAGFVAIVAVAALLASEMTGNDSIAGIPSAAATLGTTRFKAPIFTFENILDKAAVEAAGS